MNEFDMLWEESPYYYSILQHLLWNNVDPSNYCETKQLDGTSFNYVRNKQNIICMIIEEEIKFTQFAHPCHYKKGKMCIADKCDYCMFDDTCYGDCINCGGYCGY